MSKKQNRALLGLAGAALLATVVGIVIYSMNKEEENDYYSKKIKKARKSFDRLKNNDGSGESRNYQTNPMVLEDEFGVYL